MCTRGRNQRQLLHQHRTWLRVVRPCSRNLHHGRERGIHISCGVQQKCADHNRHKPTCLRQYLLPRLWFLQRTQHYSRHLLEEDRRGAKFKIKLNSERFMGVCPRAPPHLSWQLRRRGSPHLNLGEHGIYIPPTSEFISFTIQGLYCRHFQPPTLSRMSLGKDQGNRHLELAADTWKSVTFAATVRVVNMT